MIARHLDARRASGPHHGIFLHEEVASHEDGVEIHGNGVQAGLVLVDERAEGLVVPHGRAQEFTDRVYREGVVR